MFASIRVPVSADDEVGAARRCAAEMAEVLGGDEHFCGRVALLATEAARNLVRHAGGGEILVQPVAHSTRTGVEIIALDRGPGMDLGECLRDGHSTGGTAGEGLGAINRIADLFQAYSRPTQGTALLCRAYLPGKETAPPFRFCAGGVNVPVKGETACGDAWALQEESNSLRVLMADGLGHGPVAADASQAAVTRFAETRGFPLCGAMQHLHDGMRHTRGAATSLVEIKAGRLAVCGIGNISGRVLSEGKAQHLVSVPGTVGVNIRTPQEFTHAWQPESTLVLHSDGVHTQWSLEAYPGLAMRDPTLIAAVLYRDFNRSRDDATVVVVQNKS